MIDVEEGINNESITTANNSSVPTIIANDSPKKNLRMKFHFITIML